MAIVLTKLLSPYSNIGEYLIFDSILTIQTDVAAIVVGDTFISELQERRAGYSNNLQRKYFVSAGLTKG